LPRACEYILNTLEQILSLPAAAAKTSNDAAAAATEAASPPACKKQAAPLINKRQQTASTSLKYRNLPLALQKLFGEEPALHHQEGDGTAEKGHPDSATAASLLILSPAPAITRPSAAPLNHFKPSRMPQMADVSAMTLKVATSADAPSKPACAGKRIQIEEPRQQGEQLQERPSCVPPSTAMDSFRRCVQNLFVRGAADSASVTLRDAVSQAVVSSH
jgi:hypothetical protein